MPKGFDKIDNSDLLYACTGSDGGAAQESLGQTHFPIWFGGADSNRPTFASHGHGRGARVMLRGDLLV